MTESAAGVPISGTSSQRLNDENLRAVPSAAGNPSAWNSYARSGQPSGQAYTAYDPQGRAHTKVHTPSIADTEESFAPTTTTRTSHVTDREMVCRPFIYPFTLHTPSSVKKEKPNIYMSTSPYLD